MPLHLIYLNSKLCKHIEHIRCAHMNIYVAYQTPKKGKGEQ